ncbi:MAG: TetR/AcrR family transcriptional regulator [Lachnospiraceae bacterium]|nr:TetR/AcrR family transcriptional regulator [Lachnospiraceae bacterium]
MGKIEIKKENKRKDLLNAAFDLFISKGFHNTSIADIVGKAGIAKGTFYLYFKDKTDIRNRLISSKATQLFQNACLKLNQTSLTRLDEQFIFLTDEILRALKQDTSLLFFLSKHLSWGIFRSSMSEEKSPDGVSARELYEQLIARSGCRFENPEIIIYLVIELVAGTSYNAILYQDPADIEELKPYLHTMIRRIVEDFDQALGTDACL